MMFECFAKRYWILFEFTPVQDSPYRKPLKLGLTGAAPRTCVLSSWFRIMWLLEKSFGKNDASV